MRANTKQILLRRCNYLVKMSSLLYRFYLIETIFHCKKSKCFRLYTKIFRIAPRFSFTRFILRLILTSLSPFNPYINQAFVSKLCIIVNHGTLFRKFGTFISLNSAKLYYSAIISLIELTKKAIQLRLKVYWRSTTKQIIVVVFHLSGFGRMVQKAIPTSE